MNLSELKELAKQLGGIVVMNGDNPEWVILHYDHYRQLLVSDSFAQPSGQQESPEIERLNKEISVLKEEIRQKEEAELSTEGLSGSEG